MFDHVQLVARLLQGHTPATVTATGYAEGGSLARAAAVWASTAFPKAQIRCITFGAPTSDTWCEFSTMHTL